MKRLIYDLYYADKITQEVAVKLLNKWSENYNKRKYQNMKKISRTKLYKMERRYVKSYKKTSR